MTAAPCSLFCLGAAKRNNNGEVEAPSRDEVRGRSHQSRVTGRTEQCSRLRGHMTSSSLAEDQDEAKGSPPEQRRTSHFYLKQQQKRLTGVMVPVAECLKKRLNSKVCFHKSRWLKIIPTLCCQVGTILFLPIDTLKQFQRGWIMLIKKKGYNLWKETCWYLRGSGGRLHGGYLKNN